MGGGHWQNGGEAKFSFIQKKILFNAQKPLSEVWNFCVHARFHSTDMLGLTWKILPHAIPAYRGIH